MARFQFILWLAHWYIRSQRFKFQWDEGNLLKSQRKHHVYPEEIESVFLNKLAVPLGRQVAPPIEEEERFCLIGPSATGRMLSVVFTIRGEQIRPISGRGANRKERKLYEEIRKAIETIRPN